MMIEKIEFVSPLTDSHTMNDNIDVCVHLSDGRTYGFVVATPNNIFWCMENEGLDYFYGIPPVFVENLTKENIEKALHALINDENKRWLEIYGTLQISWEKEQFGVNPLT